MSKKIQRVFKVFKFSPLLWISGNTEETISGNTEEKIQRVFKVFNKFDQSTLHFARLWATSHDASPRHCHTPHHKCGKGYT